MLGELGYLDPEKQKAPLVNGVRPDLRSLTTAYTDTKWSMLIMIVTPPQFSHATTIAGKEANVESEHHVVDPTKSKNICQAIPPRNCFSACSLTAFRVCPITWACDDGYRCDSRAYAITQYMLIKHLSAMRCCCFTQHVLVKTGNCRANLSA